MHPVLEKTFWVGIGGFVGANTRYWLGGWAASRFGTQFPWGTFIINITGSFILGLFTTLVTERFMASPNLRLLVAIGFVGAYTTFSTFEYETFMLVDSGSFMRASLNIILSVLAGFFAVGIGVRLAQIF